MPKILTSLKILRPVPQVEEINNQVPEPYRERTAALAKKSRTSIRVGLIGALLSIVIVTGFSVSYMSMKNKDEYTISQLDVPVSVTAKLKQSTSTGNEIHRKSEAFESAASTLISVMGGSVGLLFSLIAIIASVIMAVSGNFPMALSALGVAVIMQVAPSILGSLLVNGSNSQATQVAQISNNERATAFINKKNYEELFALISTTKSATPVEMSYLKGQVAVMQHNLEEVQKQLNSICGKTPFARQQECTLPDGLNSNVVIGMELTVTGGEPYSEIAKKAISSDRQAMVEASQSMKAGIMWAGLILSLSLVFVGFGEFLKGRIYRVIQVGIA